MDHGKPDSDMCMDAAMGADPVVCRMQMVEDEVSVVPDPWAETTGVLPPDGGVQQLEGELEEARLKHSG